METIKVVELYKEENHENATFNYVENLSVSYIYKNCIFKNNDIICTIMKDLIF